MFGQLGQIAGLLKNAGKIKESMEQLQTRLSAARFDGDAGGGQVRCIVNGRGELLSLKIDPALVERRDIEMLEELVISAVTQAVERSREGLQNEMGVLGAAFNLPGLPGLLGGSP